MAKAAKVLLSLIASKKGRDTLKKILLVVLSPLIIIVIFVSVLGDASSKHNHNVVNTLFYDEEIPESSPLEFVEFISSIQNIYKQIDTEIASLENVKGQFDVTFIKSIILVISLNEESNTLIDILDIPAFLKNFYTKETININEEESENEEEKTAIVPIKSSKLMLLNAQSFLGLDLSRHHDALFEIYYVALTGRNQGFDPIILPHYLLSEHYENSEKIAFVGGEFGQIFEDNWKDHVSSEFGPRDPIKLPDGRYTSNYHYGIDFSYPKGTQIHAPLDGKVVLAKYTEGDYGFYVVLDHGAGIFTLYAHLSRIHVDENTTIRQGETLGEVGSTGASTGNHLHFEVIENRLRINPRKYLK